MSKIKSAIALSDLHLGRTYSYLYSVHPKFQKNSDALLALLNKIGPRDEIIINGDFLEFSFAGFDEVYRDVRAFFSVLAEAGPYGKLIYIPGNHDHHFWRTLGEQVHIDGKILQGMDPPGKTKYPCCFVDERFSSADPKLPCKIILTHFWPKHTPIEIVVKYPHHLAKVAKESGQEQYYVFTHGHFLEDHFKPVNFLIEPAHIQELEAFNNMWLELLCYNLGHAGPLSDIVNELVSAYEKGEREAKAKIKEVKGAIYDTLKSKLKLPWPKTCLLKWGLNYVTKNVRFKENAGLYRKSVDDSLKKAIEEYIDNYMLRRYRRGKAKEYQFPSDSDIPTPFTFVFGHTHRPFKGESLRMTIRGETYPLANTGGWLRTDGTGAANGENAGILVIDQTGAFWESLEGQLE